MTPRLRAVVAAGASELPYPAFWIVAPALCGAALSVCVPFGLLCWLSAIHCTLARGAFVAGIGPRLSGRASRAELIPACVAAFALAVLAAYALVLQVASS